jgi:hypothetical protein
MASPSCLHRRVVSGGTWGMCPRLLRASPHHPCRAGPGGRDALDGGVRLPGLARARPGWTTTRSAATKRGIGTSRWRWLPLPLWPSCGLGRRRWARGRLSAQKWPSWCRRACRRSAGCWSRWCGGSRLIPTGYCAGRCGGADTRHALVAATGRRPSRLRWRGRDRPAAHRRADLGRVGQCGAQLRVGRVAALAG